MQDNRFFEFLESISPEAFRYLFPGGGESLPFRGTVVYCPQHPKSNLRTPQESGSSARRIPKKPTNPHLQNGNRLL